MAEQFTYYRLRDGFGLSSPTANVALAKKHGAAVRYLGLQAGGAVGEIRMTSQVRRHQYRTISTETAARDFPALVAAVEVEA